jgi:hypothetical protein
MAGITIRRGSVLPDLGLVRGIRTLGIALLLLLPAVAQAQFDYEVANGMATLNGYHGPGGTLIIPDTIVDSSRPPTTNYYSVVGIGNNAFYNIDTLTNVIIPNSVLNIRNSAFAYCINLTNVTIGSGATNIANSAFDYCFGLTAIIVDTNNQTYSSIGGVLFDTFQSTLIQCPMGKAGTYTIPASVTCIGSSAFYHCFRLNGVVMTNGVACIGSNAFFLCSSPTNFTIPASITNIGFRAFGNCGNMKSISVATNNLFYRSVNGVLFDKNETTLIQYPGGLGGNYVIPTGVVNLGDFAFADNFYLSGITIPYGVTNIGNSAFEFCGSFRSIVIPGSVSTIGNYAFFDIDLTNVVIPDGVTSIGDYAFYGCYILSDVTISGSVTHIGTCAFSDCGNMTAISVAATNLFYCDVDGVLFDKNLTTLLTFPGSKSGDYTISDTITSIGAEAFYVCPYLTSVTIPAGVTNIGETDFYNCTSLTGFYFMGNAPAANLFSFIGDPKATVFYLPGTTGWQAFASFVASRGMPVVPWLPQAQTSDANFGVRTNQFGFNINWAGGMTVVVETCTNLANPVWNPVATNTLTGGSSYFSDPQWTNYPGRFYRLRSP